MMRSLPSLQELSPSKVFCNAIVENKLDGVSPSEGAGIWLLSRDMKVVWMNEAMEQLYGPLHLSRGKNCFMVFRNRITPCDDCLPTQAFETGNILTGYVQRMTADGIRRIYQLIEAPLFNAQHEVENVLEIVLDVTEKELLEEEVLHKEQFLANILRYSIDAIVAVDSEFVIRSWNRGAENVFGYKAKEVLGRNWNFLFAPRFRRSRQMRELRRLYGEQGFLRNVSAEMVSKENYPLVVLMSQTAIRDSHGKTIGSSIVARDITQARKEEQRDLHQKKMTAVGDLAASLAHEIKNPLNSMVINMELLKSAFSDLPHKRREKLIRYVDVLVSETQRLDKVMKKFVDFARPMDGTFERIDLKKVIHHVTHLLRPQAERTGIEIRLDLSESVPLIEGAEDYLKQIYINLMLNAMQAMPEGGTLKISLQNGKNNTVISTISDTGVGISRQHYAKIFDLYFSTKEKGSGMGLPLVHELVTAQSGTITFESRKKYGTTFTLQFPTIS